MSSTDALDLASLPQASPKLRESFHWNHHEDERNAIQSGTICLDLIYSKSNE